MTMRCAGITLGLSLLALGCGNEATAPETGSELVLLSGADQEGVVGADLPTVLTVELHRRADDTPVAHASISAQIETGGGAIRLAQGGGMAAGNGATLVTMTNPGGRASFILTLGPTAGIQMFRVSATRADAADTTIAIAALATPGPVARVVRSGDAQVALAGGTLPLGVGILLADQFGNPVGGVAVTWTVASGGGSVSAATTHTDDSGAATTSWTLGPTIGAQELEADVAGIGGFTFSATAK